MEDKRALAMAFGMDTEAGKMILALYGRPKLNNVPRDFKTKAMDFETRPQPHLRLPNASATSDVYSRSLNRAAMALVDSTKPAAIVHKPTHVAPIESIKGIVRNKEQIRQQILREEASADRAQIPLKPGRNTELEKARLAQQFTFKGGKALPEVALPAPMPGHVPLGLVTGKRAGAGTLRRGGRSSEAADAQYASSELLEELKATYEVVLRGMEESQDFINQLRKLGSATKAQETAHLTDVAVRTKELQDLQRQIQEEKARIQRAAQQADAERTAALHVTKAPMEISPAKSRSPRR
jgi:hypothetical protein